MRIAFRAEFGVGESDDELPDWAGSYDDRDSEWDHTYDVWCTLYLLNEMVFSLQPLYLNISRTFTVRHRRADHRTEAGRISLTLDGNQSPMRFCGEVDVRQCRLDRTSLSMDLAPVSLRDETLEGIDVVLDFDLEYWVTLRSGLEKIFTGMPGALLIAEGLPRDIPGEGDAVEDRMSRM